MNLDELLKIGQKTKSVKIGGIEFVLKPLTLSDEKKVLASSHWAGSDDLYARFRANEIESIPYAIDTVDGKKMSIEEKINLLNNLSSPIRRKIEDTYRELTSETQKEMDDLKNE